MVHAEAVKLRSLGRLFRRIDFIDDQENGFACASQETGKLLIGGCDAGSTIYDKEDERGVVDSDLRLLEDTDGDLTLFTGNDATLIDDLVSTPVPGDGSIDSIARDSGLNADDRAPLADQTIEQR